MVCYALDSYLFLGKGLIYAKMILFAGQDAWVRSTARSRLLHRHSTALQLVVDCREILLKTSLESASTVKNPPFD